MEIQSTYYYVILFFCEDSDFFLALQRYTSAMRCRS